MTRLVDAVQTNCHIADARGAADLTLCIYLLQMREFFRWERGIAVLQPLPREAVTQWLADREALWALLRRPRFRAGAGGGSGFEPFDAATINARLRPFGLVYGAGYVAAGRASFFLGSSNGSSSAANSTCWSAASSRRGDWRRQRRPCRARRCCCAGSRCSAGCGKSTKPGP